MYLAQSGHLLLRNLQSCLQMAQFIVVIPYRNITVIAILFEERYKIQLGRYDYHSQRTFSPSASQEVAQQLHL